MEYKLEALSPVKMKIDVTVPGEEVANAIRKQAQELRGRVQMDGFRKGKVPLNIIEKRFHDEIYNDARQALVDSNVEQIIKESGVKPLSGVYMTGEQAPLKSGEDYSYSMEFETLPKFDLPEYEGLEVEEEKFVEDPKAVANMLQRLRRMGAKWKPVPGIEPPRDGQVANISFEASENGKPLDDIKVDSYDLELGAGESLPAFEELVKGIPVGNTGEKEIAFPDDFIDPRLAGKTVTMKVTVNSVQEPDFKEFENNLKNRKITEEDLINSIKDTYKDEMAMAAKGKAQNKLINRLLKMVDFEVPQVFVDYEKWRLASEIESDLIRQGRTLTSIGKTREDVEKDMLPRAEKFARQQTLLLAIADKENLTVSDRELANQIYQSCQRSGENFKDVLQTMGQSGLLARLREHMLADKVADLLYDKAKITMVEPKADEDGETCGTGSAAPASTPAKDEE